MEKTVCGHIVDVVNKKIYPGCVTISQGKITSVREQQVSESQYILPGLIDAHIHIESSMLIPSEFARLAVRHGTVATVSDPHEIANVLGIKGVQYMIRNGKKVPFRFYFGAPSCVPATTFETAGARLGPAEIETLMANPEIRYLSEMMNFPGVLFGDQEVMKKLEIAKKYGKPVDGHAPGLKGADAMKYASAGITTDHECFAVEEALDKIAAGMKILIREGSAARNFEPLIPLLKTHPDQVMFCSDDKHPNDLVAGHINDLVRRAIGAGYDPMDVLRACTLNPVTHYGLDAGLLRPGDHADFILVDSLKDFRVLATYINGEQVAKDGLTLIAIVPEETPNLFLATPVTAADLAVEAKNKVKVIVAYDGQLITGEEDLVPIIRDGKFISDPSNDILKIVVYNRYAPSKPAVGFIRNFGLKQGAIASCVAHDSHNIVAAGVEDKALVQAINLVIEHTGGISLFDGTQGFVLPLPVAGIMSNQDAFEVAAKYEELDQKAKALGSPLRAPYMTLSFMALLVIPELKLSDKGLFDGRSFSLTSIYQM